MKSLSKIRKFRKLRLETIRSLSDPILMKDRNVQYSEEMELGAIMGSQTGERDRDPMGGGWEGTDDANSTAPSDLPDISRSPTGRILISKAKQEAEEAGEVSEMKEVNFPDMSAKKLRRMF